MAVESTIVVVGVKDALRELNNLDKVVRREITREYRTIVQQVVDDAQARVPINPPIRGMNRNWTTKSGFHMFPLGFGDDTVKAGVSGKRPKQFGGFMQNLATFYVRFVGPHAVLLDQAGNGKAPTVAGQNMARGLTMRLGKAPSRILWPAYEHNSERVESEVRQLVERVMHYVSGTLAGNQARNEKRAEIQGRSGK